MGRGFQRLIAKVNFIGCLIPFFKKKQTFPVFARNSFLHSYLMCYSDSHCKGNKNDDVDAFAYLHCTIFQLPWPVGHCEIGQNPLCWSGDFFGFVIIIVILKDPKIISLIPEGDQKAHKYPCFVMKECIFTGNYHLYALVIFIDFISSVRSSYSHPDLLLIHHPTFSDHTGPQHWTFTFWASTAI